jgi:hypothetical protein
MPNWYAKERGAKSLTSRYHGSISANIIIPEQVDKENERESAYNVLSTYLPEGGFTGDATINFNIEGVEPYV